MVCAEESDSAFIRQSVCPYGLFDFSYVHLYKFISFIHSSVALQLFVGLGRISVSSAFTQSVGLLEREINPSQGRCLHTEQHKHRIN
jgi:hypothetical protein